MRFGGFGFNQQFGFTAPAITVTDVAEGGGELFPDPTLADVADSTDGWAFTDTLKLGPTGGTGPGISATAAGDDSSANLVGTNDTALRAALTQGNTYNIAITFASVTVGGDTYVILGSDGTPVTFAAANGVVTHPVVAGAMATPGTGFLFGNIEVGATYGVTHISVEAA